MGLPVEATASGPSPGPPREGSSPDEEFVSDPTAKVDRQKNLDTELEKLTAE
jgi:hypothetical protein